MKNAAVTVALLCLLAHAAFAGPLSAADAEKLRADVAALTVAVERGDAEPLIARTHSSLHSLAGGPEEFAKFTREAVAQVSQIGVKFLSSEVGAPTQTYPAGDEEVCFVPRTSVMELEGKKVRSTTFMIAIRRLNSSDWKYIDGAGLRDRPELLYQLLPKLERGISLPANTMEVL